MKNEVILMQRGVCAGAGKTRILQPELFFDDEVLTGSYHSGHSYEKLPDLSVSELINRTSVKMGHVVKRNCVISAVGKNSLHREWIKGTPDFDLHLIVYDDSYDKYRDDTDFVSCRKGYKLKLIHEYLEENPVYLEKYDSFFLPDDDLQMDAGTISKLFRIMREQNLQIAQPALSDSYYTYEHTVRDRFCLLRYTNFVEMMAPCFSCEALKKVFFTFGESNSGWGIEYHWPLLIGFVSNEMAVIDALYVVHTRPVQSGNQRNWGELHAYLRKYNLEPKVQESGSILLPSEEINKSLGIITDRTTYKIAGQFADFLAHKFSSTVKTEEKHAPAIPSSMGIALFLYGHYRISGKRKYRDHAFSIMKQTCDEIKKGINLKKGTMDLSFFSDLFPGSECMGDGVDEIWKMVDEHFREHVPEEMYALNISQLTGLAWYYINRTKFLFSGDVETENIGRSVLPDVIRGINRWISESMSLETEGSRQCIIRCLLVLCKVREMIEGAEIDLILENLIDFLKNTYVDDGFPFLLKTYLIILASEKTDKVHLKHEAVYNAVHCSESLGYAGFQGVLNLYLLNRIYRYTNESFFKQRALELLNLLVGSHKRSSSPFAAVVESVWKKEDSTETDVLIRLGLIVLSILSEEDLEFDCYVFWGCPYI